jgi:protein kinase-like protein
VSAKSKLVRQVCGTALSGCSEACPVCALRGALGPETTSLLDFSSDLRFEHYQVLKNKDGTPVELGRGAMGITYKALDVHLQCSVALKIINARFIGDDSARRRFVREARAAASIRHPNVASVFHLGESDGHYFYAMEFVDGETLGRSLGGADVVPVKFNGPGDAPSTTTTTDLAEPKLGRTTRVNLIFWGSGWNSNPQPNPSAQTVVNDAASILSGPLSELSRPVRSLRYHFQLRSRWQPDVFDHILQPARDF